MSSIESTTVRAASVRRALAGGIREAIPTIVARRARDAWFAAPPRMADQEVPAGGHVFEVRSRGHAVVGQVWDGSAGADSPKTVYLVHGWGGRGSQFTAMVVPLVAAGYRVVMFDAPAHGESDHGPSGPEQTHGVEFAQALDAVFCRFGPAEAVVAHSMGMIVTYLTLRFGWLGTRRLVAIAPMVASRTMLEEFQLRLGFGTRVRRAFDDEVAQWIGVPISEFDATFQAARVEPVQTMVIADRSDRQVPYADAVHLATSVDAELVTTDGLGHRRILRDPAVVERVVGFISTPDPRGSVDVDMPRSEAGPLVPKERTIAV